VNAPQKPDPRASRRAAVARFRGGALEAYLLLCFGMACWGANSVAGRMAIGEISPMVITCLRWAAVSLFLMTVAARDVKAAWPVLRPHIAKLVMMAAFGFTAFNALFYVAAHYTTAVNLSILQGALPIYVMVGGALLHKVPIRLWQVIGIAATLLGVLVVATGGHLLTLADFTLNLGDGLILVACFLYALYTLALRNRPRVPQIALFATLAFLAFLWSLPLLAFEVATASAEWPTLEGWLILAFIAVFPSFLSQLAYMRGVELIGPGRASLFTNFVPIFGALFGVVILGEPFGIYHLVALFLVVAGILVAELSGRIAARPIPPDSAE